MVFVVEGTASGTAEDLTTEGLGAAASNGAQSLAMAG